LVNAAVRRALADRLMTLAGQAPMPQVRAVATDRLRRLRARVQAAPADANAQLIAADITRFLDRPMEPVKPFAAPEVPPGAPIGSLEEEWCSAAASEARRGTFFPPLLR
jgi:hypothetical protein